MSHVLNAELGVQEILGEQNVVLEVNEKFDITDSFFIKGRFQRGAIMSKISDRRACGTTPWGGAFPADAPSSVPGRPISRVREKEWLCFSRWDSIPS